MCKTTAAVPPRQAPRSFTVQARTGERRRAATQEDLLRATERLLSQGAPLASLSVEKIVAEAGVVRTTFYLHFRDKYELIERLAREQEAWIEAAGQRALSDPDLGRETIAKAISEIVAGWSANHAVLAAIIELAEYDERMRDTWLSIMQAVADVADGVFQAHWAASGGAPGDPEMVAQLLAWMIERCCHQIAGDPRRGPRLAGSLTEIIWRVVHPRAG
jgi:AcrR family transcriptional regulator